MAVVGLDRPLSNPTLTLFSSPPPSIRSNFAEGFSGLATCQVYKGRNLIFTKKFPLSLNSRTTFSCVPRSTGSSSSDGNIEDPKASADKEKVPFGYSRKDVLLIGLGVTAIGIGLKSGLEFVGVDPLQAGNVVQLVLVLGLTIGWISTYMFRVSNKDMTCSAAKGLREKSHGEKIRGPHRGRAGSTFGASRGGEDEVVESRVGIIGLFERRA